MAKSSSSSSGGIGFLGLLTVAFIVLKLCGVINWSWWLVVSPLFVIPAILLVLFGGGAALLAGAHALDKWDSHQRAKRLAREQFETLQQGPNHRINRR